MNHPVAPQPTQTTNALGIVGLVCSVLGIFGSCGLLSPIGLILSLIALNRQPRGVAIAGVVIGALGTCLLTVAVAIAILVPALFFTALIGIGIGGLLGPGLGAQLEMARLAGEIEAYQDDHGALPMNLDDLKIGDADWLTDQWGHPYGYELAPNGMSYRMFSLGPDGIEGTADDIEANPDWQFRSITGKKLADPPASDDDAEDSSASSAE